MRRSPGALVVGVLCTLTLASCGGKNSTASKSSAPPAASTAGSSSAGPSGAAGSGASGSTSSDAAASSQVPSGGTGPDKGITATIKIWHYFQASARTTEVLDGWSGEFKKSYPNVKVDWVYVAYDQMTNKLLLSGQQGNGPDGVLYDPANAAALATAKAIVDMTPYVSGWSDLPQFPKSVIWNVDGKTYSMQGYVNLLGFYYNKAILDKAGLQPAKTVAELESQMPKIKGAGATALNMPGKPSADGEFGAYPWFLGDGVDYSGFDSAAAKTVFSRSASWVKQGYVPADVVSWGPTEAFADWVKGKTAYCQCGNWELGLAKTTAKFPYGVVQQPAGSAGTHVVGGGEGVSIGSSAKNPELIAEFFKSTVLSKDGELMNFKVLGGLPTRADAASDPLISGEPLIKPFADAVATTGSRPASAKIGQAMVAMGAAWSSALSGQSSPDSAATSLAAKIKSTLSQ